jgi:hypothetical protein
MHQRVSANSGRLTRAEEWRASHQSIHRLFYRSRVTPEVSANLDLVVWEIINTSQDRNRKVGLTGLLVVVKDHFIQAREGDIDEVRTTYARISMDRRHQDLRDRPRLV